MLLCMADVTVRRVSTGRERKIFLELPWKINRDDPCWSCQWGTVTGIRDVEPGKGVEVVVRLERAGVAARAAGVSVEQLEAAMGRRCQRVFISP